VFLQTERDTIHGKGARKTEKQRERGTEKERIGKYQTKEEKRKLKSDCKK
jgi:hypothetical protein